MLNPRRQSSGISLSEVSFEHVVHDEHDLNFFLDFMVQHGSADTLLFWLEAEEYKKLPGRTEDMLAQARKIFDRFFVGSSSIPKLFLEKPGLLQDQKVFGREGYSLQKDISRIGRKLELKEPTLNMFTDAQNAAQEVLKYYFFPMFCDSLSFRALCESLRTRSSLNVERVLDSDQYVKYLDAFITSQNPQGHGNLLFYLQVKNVFRRNVDQSEEPSSRDSSPARNTEVRANSPLQKHLSDPQPSAGHKEPSPKNSELKSPSSFANLWSDTSPEFRDRTAFMKIFPSRSRGTTPSVKKRKAALMKQLHEAFNILDTFLSRGSKNDAKCVSEDSRRQIARTLEEIRFEVSSPGGKLARIGSFASSSKASAVVGLLREKLANVFQSGEDDVHVWLRQSVFPSFRNSSYFVSLAAKVEELKSGQHQQRNKFKSILMGLESSDDILVLQVPESSIEAEKTGPKGASEDGTQERVSRRRRASYLWTQFRGPKDASKVVAFAELETAMSLDFRNREEYRVIEDRLRLPTCTLRTTLKGLLFETRTVQYMRLNHLPKPENFEEDVITVERKGQAVMASDDLSSTQPSVVEEEKESHFPLLHYYAFPLGLHVRHVSPFASETAQRKASVPRRMSSGNNFLVNVPPSGKEACKQVRGKIEGTEQSKPKDQLRCFVLPSEKHGENRCFYGVSLERYELRTVCCRTDAVAKEEKDEYEEYVVSLNKHPKFGLGLNLYLDSYGFVCVSDFPPFPDGSRGAAGECGELHEDDVLLEIGDTSIARKTFQDVVNEIKASPNPLRLKFARNWQSRILPCTSCGYLRCTPLDVYTPKARILLSEKPCFDNLRKAIMSVPVGISSEVQVRHALEGDSQSTYPAPVLHARPQGPWGPVPQFPFKNVLQFLSRASLADIVAALLLERRVLLLSDDLNLLTFTAESLKCMMWPFLWEHHYNPVIPRNRFDIIVREVLSIDAPFLLGICTLDIDIVESTSNRGEYGAFEEIKSWMAAEQDSLSPVDRAIRDLRLHPLLEGGTLIVDIDSGLLCTLERTSSSDGRQGIQKQLVAPAKEIAFPEALRGTLISRWTNLVVDDQMKTWSFTDFHSILITCVYAQVLKRYREYFLTFDVDQHGTGERILAFNVKKFLLSKEKDAQDFLRVFLRTKGFAKFLLESLRTDTDVLAYSAH